LRKGKKEGKKKIYLRLFPLFTQGEALAGRTSKYKNTRLLRHFVSHNGTRTFIYKGFNDIERKKNYPFRNAL